MEKYSRFTENLLRWHDTENARVLPWKNERDPYKIWVSELMLQQTRAAYVEKYYTRFMNRFPTICALAQATDGEVFKLWEGLGYYARCRNMISTAREICTHFQGEFPCTYEQILRLKGIGPYTAAAISSFAFDLPYAVYDGNVQRILARFFGVQQPVDTPAGNAALQTLAQTLLPRERSAAFNQAIMDFGAQVCVPRSPACQVCVLREDCAAFAADLQHILPIKKTKIAVLPRHIHYLVIEKGEDVFVRLRKNKDIWRGLYEFFPFESEPVSDQSVQQVLQGVLPVFQSYTIRKRVYCQVLTHRKIYSCFVNVSTDQSPLAHSSLSAVHKSRLNQLPFPKIIRDFLRDHPIRAGA